MSQPFITRRRVEFIDTDMVGIVHYSNFARYAEAAESEFFRALGLKLVEKSPDGTTVGWPRVACSFSFKAPALFEDLVEIRVSVARIGVRSMTLAFEFVRDGKLLATGELQTAFCVMNPGEPLKSLDIPDDVRARFQPYVVESESA